MKRNILQASLKYQSFKIILKHENLYFIVKELKIIVKELY